MTAKTVRLSIVENENEELQRELKNTPELLEPLILEDTRLLITAGNTTMTLTGKTRRQWIMKPTQQQGRLTKQFIHSAIIITSFNHISGISYGLPSKTEIFARRVRADQAWASVTE